MSSPQTVRGRLIVLEGIDGSGTTTQTERVSAWLRTRNQTVLSTREPTSGPVGRFLRTALRQELSDEQGDAVSLDWAAMALLFAADRVDHVTRHILPALLRGETVVSDRYDLSSLLYQSLTSPQGSQVLPWLKSINAQALRPDLTLVLDVPSDLAEARRAARGGAAELYEQAELQRRLSQGYATAQALLPDDKIVNVAATGSVDEVFDKIIDIIQQFERSWAAS